MATSAPRDVTVAPGSPRTSPAEREVVTAVIAYGLDRIGAARSVGQFASFCATGRRRPPRGCTTLNRALAAGWEVIVTFDDGLAVASPLVDLAAHQTDVCVGVGTSRWAEGTLIMVEREPTTSKTMRVGANASA